MRIDHINVVVKDLQKATDFFVTLGFTIKTQGQLQGEWIDKITGLQNVNATYVALGFPDKETNLELLSFTSPEIIPDADIHKPNHLGFRHMAIAVDNIDKVVTELRTKGITFISDIQKYGEHKRLCYFYGPENILLELAEYT